MSYAQKTARDAERYAAKILAQMNYADARRVPEYENAPAPVYVRATRVA